jgi:hypothetical protein
MSNGGLDVGEHAVLLLGGKNSSGWIWKIAVSYAIRAIEPQERDFSHIVALSLA